MASLRELVLGFDPAELQENINSLHDRIGELEEKIEEKPGAEELETATKDIREELERVEDIARGTDLMETSFTRAEREVIGVLYNSGAALSTNQLAEAVDKSNNVVRSLLSRIREKVVLQERKDGRRKLYALPETVHTAIEQGELEVVTP